MTGDNMVTITIMVDDATKKQESYWVCDSCGSEDNPKECSHCLACGSTHKMPSYLYRCPVCGWVEPKGLGNPPAFCGGCGARAIKYPAELT